MPRYTAVLLAASLVAAGVATGPGVSPAGAVATDQSYWVPVDKRVVVHGHGYGHGHGMSQYGAQGAALKGLPYKEIIDFYYPGTSWRTMRGKVRVLITADTTDDVEVSPTTGLRVRDVATGEVHTLPERAAVTRWRLHVREGRTVVQRFTDRWRRFHAPWARNIAGDAEFLANTPITLWTPAGPRTYRGVLRAASPTPGSSVRDTVNIVSMNQYVMGVVPAEMPASWHAEAVKAQSVAARTYATWSRNQNMGRYYQICDTTACQVYGGVGGEDPRSNAAVRATGRQILTYAGKPAFTQFSASSGGWTRAGSVPYLPAQEDPYDGWEGNSVHRWSATADLAVLERSYPAVGSLRRLHVTARDGNGDWQGRVESLVLDGTKGRVTISGDAFRWAFGLRSSWFTIEPTPIMSRWSRIGGPESPVGEVRSGEFAVGAGAAQRFEQGRIFYSRATGARELYGPVLRAYLRTGGPSSALGFPRTPVRVRTGVNLARFQNGSVYHQMGHPAVAVTGAIDRRYVKAGGLGSRLGRPTRTNFTVRGGERANFEHGFIRWWRASGSTRVRVTG